MQAVHCLIALGEAQLGAVMQCSGMLPCLLHLLGKDEHVRFAVAKFIRTAARIATPDQTRVFVDDSAAVKVLASSLQHFKTYDQTLRQVYQVCKLMKCMFLCAPPYAHRIC